MTGLKLFSPVALSLTLTVFAPTSPGSMDAEALRGPVTPSVASFQPSFDWRSDLGTPMSATTTGCLTVESGDAVGTADVGPSSTSDPHRAVSEGLSSTQPPLPDTCPTREEDEVFWQQVDEQVAEKCGTEEGNEVLEIECEEVGDVYVFRARVICGEGN